MSNVWFGVAGNEGERRWWWGGGETAYTPREVMLDSSSNSPLFPSIEWQSMYIRIHRQRRAEKEIFSSLAFSLLLSLSLSHFCYRFFTSRTLVIVLLSYLDMRRRCNNNFFLVVLLSHAFFSLFISFCTEREREGSVSIVLSGDDILRVFVAFNWWWKEERATQ